MWTSARDLMLHSIHGADLCVLLGVNELMQSEKWMLQSTRSILAIISVVVVVIIATITFQSSVLKRI